MCSTPCCMRLADTIEKQVELRRKVKSAMTYPIVVLVDLLCSSSTAMLLFIVPQFKAIYADLGGELPLPTRVLITLSDILKTWFPSSSSSPGSAVFFFRRWIKSDARPGRLGRVQAAGAGVRRAHPQDRAGPLLAHAGGADPFRVSASSRRSTSSPRPSGNEVVSDRAARDRRARSSAATRSPAPSSSTRCSRRWSCR